MHQKKARNESNGLLPPLMLKILATAVQTNTKPLKVTCVNTLNAGFGKGRDILTHPPSWKLGSVASPDSTSTRCQNADYVLIDR